ncbi:hypothetical protein F0562_032763 [Nyssa sinensis]|uniref:Uncharacterized protein n=1 Tax=Nyssa sinensis TaxID=561372 RepID=A0A5J5AQ56_9ASTE|nr:hypothetical protein F0562_032763 [Nyssa sinensis]
MFPSSSDDFQKMSSSPAPSAPPQPPPLRPPPSTPLPSHFENPTTTTGNPVNMVNRNIPPCPPARSNFPPHFPVAWSTGLCNFCDDTSSCCLTCWCPCVVFGRIAEIVDRGSTSCGVSGALYMLIMVAWEYGKAKTRGSGASGSAGWHAEEELKK